MEHKHRVPNLAEIRTTLEDQGPRIFGIAATVGVVFLLASFALGVTQGDSLRRFGFSYLVSFAFYLSLSLGALFFVAIQHITRASWSVVVRRLAEIMAANLPLLALLLVPILLNLSGIYSWAAGHDHGNPDLLAYKRPFLNPTFFLIRWAVYFCIWSILGVYFWRRSLEQDLSGDPELTLQMEKRSGPTLLLFALTVTLASFDLMMSLDFTWFSTIFGVYYFSGGVVAFYAFMTLMTQWLQRSGRLTRIITMEHYHDYGKLMFAFVFFWAYIAFSQYMLIWYANIPEETIWYLRRQEGNWGWLGLVLLFGHFLLPFLGLVSRFAKRNLGPLAFWAAWIIVMHYLDLYWVIMPELGEPQIPFHLLDLTCFLGVGGIYCAGLARLAGRRPLIPMQDPRLENAILFENA